MVWKALSLSKIVSALPGPEDKCLYSDILYYDNKKLILAQWTFICSFMSFLSPKQIIFASYQSNKSTQPMQPTPTIPLKQNSPDQMNVDRETTIPTCNDVLLGRGNFAKQWNGNKFYRWLIQRKKYEYVVADTNQKHTIALEIVEKVGRLSPSGRFLAKDKKTDTWREVETDRAIRKTAQALREDAPNILRQITPLSNEQEESIGNDEEFMNFLTLVSNNI